MGNSSRQRTGMSWTTTVEWIVQILTFHRGYQRPPFEILIWIKCSSDSTSTDSVLCPSECLCSVGCCCSSSSSSAIAAVQGDGMSTGGLIWPEIETERMDHWLDRWMEDGWGSCSYRNGTELCVSFSSPSSALDKSFGIKCELNQSHHLIGFVLIYGHSFAIPPFYYLYSYAIHW